MAEIAGVALGAVPLVMSAIENYNKTAKFFGNLKHYPRNLKKALDVLETQELCFRKANERILRSVVDEAQARQMLVNLDHDYWHDEDVATKYGALLAESLPGFASAIALVRGELDTIRKEFQKFELPQHESAKQLKKRLRWAFSHSKIEESLGGLREKTQDFVSLTTLVTTCIQVSTNEGGSSTSTALKRKLNRFSKVKQTAEDLYLALSRACTVHTDHQVHLNLDPGYSDPEHVQFTLAFSQLSIKNQTSRRGMPTESTWLTIDSSVTGKLRPVSPSAANFGALKKPLKRSFGKTGLASDGAKSTMIKKFLRFQDEEWTDPKPGDSNRPSPNPLVNLCKKGNFCHQLTKFLGQSHPSGQPIGSLETSRGSRHLIYIDSKHQTLRETLAIPKLKTLRQVIKSTVEDDTTMGITLFHKVHLAKQLATAVLHFQTTAWLQESWDSQKILVTTEKTPVDDCTSNPAFHAYVTAIISGFQEQPASMTVPSLLVVKNRLLFSLGTLLLELAYQKSLDELANSLDRTGVSLEDVAYRTSERLSKRVSAVMGPRFAQVIHKCIHCDFGHGFDLKQPKLQEAFYRTVVCELAELEKAL